MLVSLDEASVDRASSVVEVTVTVLVADAAVASCTASLWSSDKSVIVE
jgi:hypothetical protein